MDSAVFTIFLCCHTAMKTCNRIYPLGTYMFKEIATDLAAATGKYIISMGGYLHNQIVLYLY